MVNLQEQFDSSTLAWVRIEVTETLQRARRALEAFLDGGGQDPEPLQLLVALLHEVGGALALVDLPSAALFTAELEQFASRSELYRDDEERAELLMRGVLLIPEYMEYIEQGGDNSLYSLVSAVNDLRQLNGRALLRPLDHFEPNPHQPVPADFAGAQASGDSARQASVKLLKFMQGALDQLTSTGAEPAKGLQIYRTVLQKLAPFVAHPTLQQWLWITTALVDGLDSGMLTMENESRSLLIKAGDLIRFLAQKGESGLAIPAIQKLNRLMLWKLANTQNPYPLQSVAAEVFHAYRLGGFLSRNDAVMAINAETKQVLAEDILRELSRIKERLDICVRTGRRDEESLRAVMESLQMMRAPLTIIEQMEAVAQLQQIGQILERVLGSSAADPDAMMEVASLILQIESQLRSWSVKVTIATEEQQRSSFSSEHNAIIQRAMAEARGDLLKARDGLTRYLEQQGDKSLLQEPIDLLAQMRGILSLLNYERLARIIHACALFVRDELLHSGSVPTLARLEPFADAMMAAEYFLDAFVQKRVHPATILAVAERALEQLGYSLQQLSPLTLTTPIEQDDEEEVAEMAALMATMEPEGVAAVRVETVQAESILGGSAAPPLSSVESRVMASAAVAPIAPPLPLPLSKFESLPSTSSPLRGEEEPEIDEEILEIFIEEAESELAAIGENLPLWQQNPAAREALSSIRRSYHTLKGSGRLVGAELLGEFAWSFENLLNRIIDGVFPPSATIFDMVEQSLPVLSQMVIAFRDRQPLDLDYQLLQDFANQLVAHDGVLSAAVEEEPPARVAEWALSLNEVEEPAVADEEMATVEATKGFDPELLAIYTQEMEIHLQTLREFITHRSRHYVDEPVMRAIHTLNGSSRMAEVSVITALIVPLEEFVRHLQLSGQIVTDEVRHFLSDGVHFMEEVRQTLLAEQGRFPSNGALVARLEQLRLANEEAVADLHFNPEAGMASVAEEELLPLGVPAPTAAELSVLSLMGADQAEFDLIAMATRDTTATLSSSAGMPLVTPISALPLPQPAAQDPLIGRLEHIVINYDAEDSDLLEIFLEEAVELIDASEGTLHLWSEQPDNLEFTKILQRQLHTLKGGARLAGIMPMGDLSHGLESAFEAVVDGVVHRSAEMFHLLQLAHDRLVTMLNQVKAREPVVSGADLLQQFDRLRAGKSLELNLESLLELPDSEAEELLTPTDGAALPSLSPPEASAPVERRVETAERRATTPQAAQDIVRVRSDLLDDLVNYAAEVSIYRSRVEQQIGKFSHNLKEMDQTVHRLREQLRKFDMETEAQIDAKGYKSDTAETASQSEFDPLEFDRFTTMQQLSRSMMESLSDIQNIKETMSNLSRETETLLLQQSRVNSDLQESLVQTRMLPLADYASRLRRLVRQVSTELDKRANLTIRGAEVEMDRNIVERIIAPLEHLIRNSLAHGIESSEQRQAAGKPLTGEITLTVHREGSEIVIEVSDDGQGIRIDKVRQKAITQGLMGITTDLTDDEMMQFIFESGFSTATEVSQIAGRGVGMDVVNSEVRQLGGNLHVDSQAGRGARFTIRLPLTLTVTRALLVESGESTYAIPLLSVRSIERIDNSELSELLDEEKPVFEWFDGDYEIYHLTHLLGEMVTSMLEEKGKQAMLLVQVGEHRVAILVDRLIGSREVVVKSLGLQLSVLPKLAGATIMGDGRVVLILDVPALIRHRAQLYQELQKRAVAVLESQSKRNEEPLIMVVDDSITVRKVTERLLKRQNMRCMTAKDGVDALAHLEHTLPDLMLLDIEMPRMDGFELATHIRNNQRLRHIPIIMITSRSGDKHRNRAFDIGVNDYMSKPYSESALLAAIQHQLGLVGG